MGRQDHGQSAALVLHADQLGQLVARAGIEPGKRLVEDEQLGLDDERTRERDLPTFTTRKVMRHLVEKRNQVEGAGNALDPGTDLAGR